MQQDLCRLAIGGQAQEPAEILARHARGCATCRDFADDLAGVSRWLDRNTPTPRCIRLATATATEAASDDPVVRRACEALERELGARLARDLLELGQGHADREPDSRRLDLQRLIVLRGTGALRQPPWRQVLRLLSRRRLAVDRRGALHLATQLDPLGLDVALVHLGQLEKDGLRAQADAEVDRLLGRWQ